MTRIVIFSPYACRYHLTAYEGTIAKACQIRGATVEYLLCDGLLPECDQHWDSFPFGGPRPFDICQGCQTGAKKLLAEFSLPYKWLGEFISKEDQERVFAWSQSLAPSEIRHVCYMNYPVGDWVMSSVISYFRQYPPDMSKWRVVNAYRGFVYSASIVAIGIRNYLDAHSVDATLLFNGRQSITRVAFEIFRERGIRELTHEFPFYKRGHIMVKPNAKCWSLEPFSKFWCMWGDVPLDRLSLEKTLKWLRNRRYGKDLSWYAFNKPYTPVSGIREELNLSQNKHLLALFTSSTDETAGDPELHGPYELQDSWVQDVVDWVKDRNDVELVIRVHPHLAGTTGLGKALDEINFYENLRNALPYNVRIVMPDDSLNSYALMDEADIGLTFGSSAGIEMALLGKVVVLGSRSFYENGSHILTIRSKESLSNILEKSLQSFSVREIRREAFRLAYYYVFMFEVPFPSVSMVGVRDIKLNYSDPKDLEQREDDALDHICNFLMGGSPLFKTPTETELNRSTVDEDEFFEELERSSTPMRDMDHERWMLRMYGMNRVGRSIQNGLQRLPFGTGFILNRIGKAIYLPIFHWVGKKSDPEGSNHT